MYMKMLKFILIILLGYSAITYSHAQQTVSIFNGKDLSGWAVHGTEKWYVENGLLVRFLK